MAMTFGFLYLDQAVIQIILWSLNGKFFYYAFALHFSTFTRKKTSIHPKATKRLLSEDKLHDSGVCRYTLRIKP